MSKYFVVAIGRSGTRWLSELFGHAANHICGHEVGDTRSKVIPQPWTPFPIERWAGKDSYGEVNGMLRYHLSGQCLGREMEFETLHRIYLRRNMSDIIYGWMQLGDRELGEFSATCYEILWHAANLEAWAKLSGSRVIDVEDLWNSKARTQELVDSLKLDLNVTGEMMVARGTRPPGLPTRFGWDNESVRIAKKIALRVGYPYGERLGERQTGMGT